MGIYELVTIICLGNCKSNCYSPDCKPPNYLMPQHHLGSLGNVGEFMGGVYPPVISKNSDVHQMLAIRTQCSHIFHFSPILQDFLVRKDRLGLYLVIVTDISRGPCVL